MIIEADKIAKARDDLFPRAGFDHESQDYAIHTFARTLQYVERLEDDLRKSRRQHQTLQQAADKLASYVLRGNQWALSRDFVESLLIKANS